MEPDLPPCDQMFEIKSSPFFPKVAQNVATTVLIEKGDFFKIAQKLPNSLRL